MKKIDRLYVRNLKLIECDTILIELNKIDCIFTLFSVNNVLDVRITGRAPDRGKYLSSKQAAFTLRAAGRLVAKMSSKYAALSAANGFRFISIVFEVTGSTLHSAEEAMEALWPLFSLLDLKLSRPRVLPSRGNPLSLPVSCPEVVIRRVADFDYVEMSSSASCDWVLLAITRVMIYFCN